MPNIMMQKTANAANAAKTVALGAIAIAIALLVASTVASAKAQLVAAATWSVR